MVELPLYRKGEIVAWTKLDDADAVRLSGRKLTLTVNGYVRVSGYRLTYLHRLLLGLEPRDGREADHINRDRLDNRRENLRVVTRALNMQNMGANHTGTSRYRGVSWSNENNGWRAQAQVNGRNYALGTFAREEDAAAVAREFRRRNMPGAVEEEAA